MCLCSLLSALLTGGELAFVVSNKTFFELLLQYVANSNISGCTEVSLEFMAPSDSTGKKLSKGQPNEMVKVQFFMPSGKCVSRGQMISNHVEYFTWFDMIIEMRVSFYKNQII